MDKEEKDKHAKKNKNPLVDNQVRFPYEKVRPVQDMFIHDVENAMGSSKGLIVHAPTGVGKTAAVLFPALKEAQKKHKKILFLTSRHTQHRLAIDTLRDISKASGIKIKAADIIGKRWMCLQPGTENLYSNEFAEYCKSIKESGKCEFYSKTRNSGGLSVEAKLAIEECQNMIKSTEELTQTCSAAGICPYELSLEIAMRSEVIIADYYYVFDEDVSRNFFSRTRLNINNCIIIIDEAHNLPKRIMDTMTSKLSSVIIKRALKEAKKFGYNETAQRLEALNKALFLLANVISGSGESLVLRDNFINLIKQDIDYDEMLADFEFIGDSIRETQRQSYVGSIGMFLELWKGPDEGYARIISKKEKQGEIFIELSNNCLDPSLVSKSVISEAYSTIMMSGTLTPTGMYNDVMGFDNSIQKTYGCPFPKKNRLNLIIPRTTTKYQKRNEEQYRAIAEICADITDIINGNSILFFPSYFVRDMVNLFFSKKSKKTVFLEQPSLTKKEREDILLRFKEYKKTGAVLLCVSAGSFSEGIDLPGDLLKCVIVVGLPLQQPDLKTKELIKYYDEKFGKGWDYGYLFPAFNKALQSAGRCIRSEKDKGVIVFLDERYLWPNYFKCFPPDWKLEIGIDYESKIKSFFAGHDRE